MHPGAALVKYKVSYYAHHHGTGHLRHAQRLAELGGMELQVASTGERRLDLLSGDLEYVALPADAGPLQKHGKMRSGDALHYAPVGPGIQRRFTMLNQAWARFAPDVVMVDVSVEVALFARLSGYPVAFRRMPGDRTDPAHRLAYEVSDGIFGYFPAALEDPAHLRDFGEKSHYLGVPGSMPAPTVPRAARSRRRRVVVQTSLASSIPLRQLADAAAASSGWQWEVAGAVDQDGTPLPPNLRLHGVLSDPTRTMSEADLVISSAGHNAVVAAAASGRPVLLVPEDRPHGEQLHFARALEEKAGVPVLGSWETTVDWPDLLERAVGTDPATLASTLLVTPSCFSGALESMLAACLETAGT
jgi:hypothetical protein